jgi:flagellar biosynthetic protein FlhB
MGDKDDKTELPTERKKEDARKDGNVFQSKDVATVVVLLGAFFILKMMLPFIYRCMSGYLRWILNALGNETLSMDRSLAFRFLTMAVECCAPILVTALFVGILSHGIQTRFNVSFKSLKPKLGRMNPLAGISRMFSLRNFMEFLKSLMKVILLGIFLYSMIKKDIYPIARMINMTPEKSVVNLLHLIWDLLLRVILAFAVIGAFDFMFQKRQYTKDLMMTKQEVKEEYKMTEGNPEVKNRMKQKHREMSNQRMMQEVPKADVIVRNPTHVAVAIRYDPEKHGAPYIVAKGLDHMALRIVEVGEKAGIPWVENKPLARAIYAACEIGQEIPSEYYGAVAELLVYIYRQDHREDKLR